MKAELALRRFAERKATWMNRYGPQFAGKDPESTEAILEHHLRSYFIDDVLRSLNWSLTVADAEEPNLLAELPIVSPDTEHTKFIDYLGLEADTARPLMVVETKRFRSPLPQDPDDPKSRVPVILAEALAGKRDDLTYKWPKWLDALSAYVRSAAERGGVPQLAVMTDGAWIIIFKNPQATFIDGREDVNAISATDIAFFSFDRIEAEHTELYELLEYQHVLGETQPLAPAELGFYIQPDQADRVMHALRVIFTADPGFYEPSPRIKVKPVLLLATAPGGWIVIEDADEGEILPTNEELLVRHLAAIRTSAERLVADISTRMQRRFAPVSLTSHYADANAFLTIPGVRYHEDGGGDRWFVVATGQHTHYLRPEPSVPHCPFHEWSPVHGNANAPRGQSVDPPSFFSSGAAHYCGHRTVDQVKHSPATKANRDRTGPRSAHDGGAFCEVWSLDQFLCCRTCAFEEVCRQSDLFDLPCRSELPGEHG